LFDRAHQPDLRAGPHQWAARPARRLPWDGAVRRRPAPIPTRRWGPAARSGLRTRPVLLTIHCPRRGVRARAN